MTHLPLFFGSEALHLALRIIGYVLAMIVIALVIVSIERANGNGARWPLRLLVWPLGAVTLVSLLIAGIKTLGVDATDALIYTTWFKVGCLLAFWTLAHRKH
jgi:hypothetical protein